MAEDLKSCRDCVYVQKGKPALHVQGCFHPLAAEGATVLTARRPGAACGPRGRRWAEDPYPKRAEGEKWPVGEQWRRP